MNDREEREFLLRSLDDLDAEFAAGDMDEDDYHTLRDSYSARLAPLLRDAPPAASAAPSAWRGRLAWLGAAVVVAVVSGVLLARSVGHRAEGDGITGSAISESDRAQSCQRLSFQEPKKGVDCYAKILADQPDNLDALTYSGWALVRSGDVDAGSKRFDRVVTLDPTYPDVYVFRASVAKNAGDFVLAQQQLDTLYALNPPKGVLSTLQTMGLDRTVALGLMSDALQKCWTPVEKLVSDGSSKDAVEVLTDATGCASEQVSTNPGDVYGQQMLSYLYGSLYYVSGDATVAGLADQVADRAVDAFPQDATLRILRAALRNVEGRPAEAKADLDLVATLGRVNPLFPVATEAQIRQSITEALTSTTTTVPADGAGTASTTTTIP